MRIRWCRLVALGGVAVVALLVLQVFAPAAGAAGTDVSREQAIEQLQKVRTSINETLDLFKQGKDAQALKQSQAGYLNHFEYVEIPLRVADPQFTLDAESKFAEVRQSIRDGRTDDVRERIVELRGIIDEAERRLSSPGLTAPVLVTSQSFLIIFREGLEAVLLLAVLLGYLEAAKANQFRRPILWGVGLAVLATLVTIVAVHFIIELAPVGREVMEAATAILAVVVLFWVSFWLIARLEHERWMEFIKARVWTAVSLGSAASLMLIGFTAVYREGFETVLFYEALFSFGQGLAGWILLGLGLGLVALAAVTVAIFKLGRKLPVKAFLSVAVLLLMATSIAFLGNAVYELQQADLLGYHPLAGWPRLPIYLAQATGYYPTRETVFAQVALLVVYLLGAVWMFVVRPAMHGGRRPQKPVTASSAPVSTESSAETREPDRTPAGAGTT
jgi:high-affinity iron transporter